MEEVTDIVIIGGGPAGLSAAINGRTRGKTVRVLSNAQNNLAKTEMIQNYLGYSKVTGQELMAEFRSHAQAMGVEIETGKVTNILPLKNQFVLSFGNDVVSAKAVILALGIARAKEIPGEGTFLGNGVSYCATCDGMLYRDKSVVVYGLADNAVEEANFLQKIGAKVTFVANGQRSPELNEAVAFISGSVVEIRGQERVTEIVVKPGAVAGTVQGEANQPQILAADGVFLLRNSIAPTALVPGLETDNGYIKVDRAMQTNIPGLYACGDCTGGLLQVSKATGEGLVAAQQAAKWIDANRK
jgi:thioredoxin reductase (NADPH)